MSEAEYKSHIDTYANHGQKYFSNMLSAENWGDQRAAELYLKKFWLPLDEYQNTWKPVQDRVFLCDNVLPEIIFNTGYQMMAFRGGCLFAEDDFIKLQKCFIDIGDSYFVVIENTFGGKLIEPAFRMKYPTNISWDELKSGNFVSATILDSLHKEFFVFGKSAGWGKYSASDYKMPLDIVGFRSQYSKLFHETLKVPKLEWHEIYTWLPPQYKQIVKAEL